MYKNRLKIGNKYGLFFIGEFLRENGWTENERGAKRGLHSAFLRRCKSLIFRVHFTGAGCSYIYRYSCTLHQPFQLLYNWGDLQELGKGIVTIGSNGKVGTFWCGIYACQFKFTSNL